MMFDLKRYAIHDGPGIRTTVFLKGCTLRCRWCHSPESQSPDPEVLFLQALCAGCGACARACALGLLAGGPAQLDHSHCTACGACAAACYSGALVVAGRSVTVGELLESVLRDRLLYETTGGGVTVSGGEPALQPRFTGELIGELRRLGVHTAVETAGNVPWPDLAQAVAGADLILFDLKHADSAAHASWTGAANELIVANLRRLAAAAAESGQHLIVRIPVIPGANSDQAALAGMASLLADLPHLDGIELLPYHNLGVPKYDALRREYAMPEVHPPTSEELRLAAGTFREAGLEVKLESEGSR